MYNAYLEVECQMKLLVTDNHSGEGAFPIFSKGTAVKNIAPSEAFLHWMACTVNGVETFVPDVYIADDKLNTDYDPTELIAAKGDIVEIQKIVYEWLYAKTEDGVSGWLPANKTISVQE